MRGGCCWFACRTWTPPPPPPGNCGPRPRRRRVAQLRCKIGTRRRRRCCCATTSSSSSRANFASQLGHTTSSWSWPAVTWRRWRWRPGAAREPTAATAHLIVDNNTQFGSTHTHKTHSTTLCVAQRNKIKTTCSLARFGVTHGHVVVFIGKMRQ